MICSQSGWAWLVFLFHSILGSIYRGRECSDDNILALYGVCRWECIFNLDCRHRERYRSTVPVWWMELSVAANAGRSGCRRGDSAGRKGPARKKKKSDGQRGSGSGFYFSQRGSAGIPARVELRVKHYQRFRLVCIGIARRFSCRIFPLHAGRTDNNRICRPRRSINQSNSHRTVTKPAACP